MKKAIFIILAAALVLAMFLFFTGAVGEIDPSLDVGTKENDTLIIGVYEPLSGIEEEGGRKELLGIRYANSVSPTVEIAGIQYNVQLLELDNESDPETAELDGRFFAKEGVTAVIGSYGSALSEAGARALAESGLPLIQASSTTPGLNTISPTAFRICYDDSFQANVIASYAAGKGLKTAVVLTEDGNVYSNSLATCFADEFIRLEGNVFAYSYERGQNNFQSISSMIQSVKADAVFLPSTIGTTANIIKQLRRNGVDCAIFGCDSFDSAALMESCSRYGKDVFFCSGFDDTDMSNIVAAEFVPKFRLWMTRDQTLFEMNGKSEVVSPLSALGYDAYMVLIDALGRSESLAQEDINAALAATDHSGVTGRISFDANGGLLERHTYIKCFNVDTKEFEILQTSSVGK